MYIEHFKLNSQPFSEHASHHALWLDDRMAEGLSRLNYLVRSGVVGLVTGPSGVGKSALLKRFMHEQSSRVCEPVYCHLAHLPAAGMLKLIVTQLGEVPRRGKDRLYQLILDRAQRTEGALLLILDEAHLLSGESLIDLRLLVSSAVDVGPPLKILLVGQESLKNTLRRSEYADLVNRISVRYQLRALSQEQTATYIDQQLTYCGGDPKIFDSSVKELIHEFTGGNPRGINNAAIACLMHATAKRVVRIDDEIFRRASIELQWN